MNLSQVFASQFFTIDGLRALEVPGEFLAGQPVVEPDVITMIEGEVY